MTQTIAQWAKNIQLFRKGTASPLSKILNQSADEWRDEEELDSVADGS